MTVKELSQLFYLNNEINHDRERLAELESRRGIGALNFDGMPHAKGMTRSQVEQLAAEIVDLQAIIHAKLIQCIHERNRLERYIASIPDAVTRQVFEYRFAQCYSWAQVAEHMGGGNTPDGVRMRCYRYLQAESDDVTECSVRS